MQTAQPINIKHKGNSIISRPKTKIRKRINEKLVNATEIATILIKKQCITSKPMQ
jgi:hypothetical protein